MSLRRSHIRELLSPINNPKPDGRKNNWTGAKQFPAGRYYVDHNSIRKVSASRYDAIYAEQWRGNPAQFTTLIEHSHKVDPKGISELLLALGSEDDAATILGLLLKQGAVTAEQIEAAAIELDESEDLYKQV